MTAGRHRVVAAVLLVLAGCSHPSRGLMTATRFRELVTGAGDTVPLSAPLAAVPFWRKAMVKNDLRFQDGRTFQETCPLSAKTVAGTYIVFTIQSEFYHQPVYSVMAYDTASRAYKTWGLYGDVLTEATMTIDPLLKTTHSESTYGDGFREVSNGTFSDTEIVDRTVVYKAGAVFLKRESRTTPSEVQGRPTTE
jgi:hypothetical protein